MTDVGIALATERADPGVIAVSGASGWIGARVCALARARGRRVRALTRHDLGPDALAGSLAGCSLLVHAAGLAHTGRNDAEHQHANAELSARVGATARNAGVRRMVYVSSARVMGSVSSRPFNESDAPAPDDSYSRAKLDAERALASLHAPERFEVVVVRPPLVYGAGVRANFLALLRAAGSRLPLPLADATAPRSMIHLDNLVDCLLFLCDSKGAAGRAFFTSDGHDISVRDLVTAVRACRGRRPLLFSVPEPLWRLAGTARAAAIRQRLFKPFQVDISAILALGWTPPITWQDAIASTAAWHAGDRRASSA